MNIYKAALNGTVIGFIVGLLGINIILYALGLAVVEDMSYKINIAFGIVGGLMGSISSALSYLSIKSEFEADINIEEVVETKNEVLGDIKSNNKKSFEFD